MPVAIATALKEWAVAVDALTRGDTIMLLRKGGIREQGGRFTVKSDRVWLYPTYEHQKPHLLEPEYANAVEPVASGWHPEVIPIRSYADITDIFQVSEAETVKALLPYHIWNDRFASERFNWKPSQPLYVLLLRVYRLGKEQKIPYRPEYGGCRSWIDLAQTIDAKRSIPVLDEDDYQARAREIQDVIRE